MSELDNLYSRRSSYRRRKAQCEEQRAAIREKIERLKAAKVEVSTVKLRKIEPMHNYIASKAGTHADTWSGNRYNDVMDIHESEINVRYQNYYDDTDEVLDAICDEITRLENENRDLGILLNSIVNTLNYIGNEIEKWLN